ncbi:2-oxoacid:ferredoxin oxidoreductase subunit alpha [Pseudothermotoga hypogea DSM 11164 = NBRC 106472]|uniref:2-oxoacid:ferredoxin oxidoreductase subunit alpha n=1 Tax=Pseudothermotoga hypogea DSM 11164 = NBRC 106472 TaxID=1123384 RepID=A0A0X1KQG3_9THEM|nr:2-oxoacid:acceptor oxidoreductase subunit alpha [Pseudothermotoga hypogea]AJC73558.1 2-oxoacid:ferredoxin oxidoreductase subunit alpha [Pseudothermotoga hypogea DSM 11164 = NBRC 106472]
MYELNEVSVVISGAAGQGIQAVEHLLSNVVKDSDLYVFATKEYMSRVRGGNNSTTLRISCKPVYANIDRIDLLLVLNENAIERHRWRMTTSTIVLGEEKFVKDETNHVVVEFSKIAESFGNRIYANSVATGVLAGIMELNIDALKKNIEQYFVKKGNEVINANVSAALKGYELGRKLGLKLELKKCEEVRKKNLLNGSMAVALGAVAGGCNFVSSYPMSPSTAVFTELAKMSKTHGILVEQAEDEIAAANMVIAAWYAGARGLVTTSGGGFALMCEAISLAGMIETPIVVHLGQRPGPATGLPTRTEQADLNLVLYAGHGEFPRVIYAPGSIEEAYELTAKAFNVADKFQIPVFVLTDQYLLDSYYLVDDLPKMDIERHIVKTDANYRRYTVTEDGISPRGIPGYGEGLVRVDSDEHDEFGHITESSSVRKAMVEKRLRKMNKIIQEALPPKLSGPKDYEVLIVSWGSTYLIVEEALQSFLNHKIAHLHFSQVYPIHPSAKEYFEKAKRVIFIEQNATGQFANLVQQTFLIDTSERILKYDGYAYSVEQIAKAIRERLGV